MKYLAFFAVLVFMGCTNQTKQTTAASKTVTTPPAVVAPGPAAQKATQASEELKKMCAKGSDKRELEVVKKGAGCVLDYTQDGKMKEQTMASRGSKHCETSEVRIIAKLEKSGFQCN